MYLKIALVLIPVVFSVSKAGEYAADFLNIDVGARAAGMGGAFTAIADDATAFYWNPAGLVSQNEIRFHADHVPVFNGLAQYNVLSAGFPVQQNAALAVGWIRLGVDDIPRYAPLLSTTVDRLTSPQNRSDGQPIGYFSDNENAFFVSLSAAAFSEWDIGFGYNKYTVPIEFSFGLSGKYILHQLDDHAGSGQGIDAGLRMRFYNKMNDLPAASWLSIGLMARDVSRTAILWDTSTKQQDRIDPRYRLGAAFSLPIGGWNSRVTVSCDRDLSDQVWYAGAELDFFDTVVLRGGYRQQGPSAGAGLTLGMFRVDYAFVMHELAHTHRVSGAVHF
ncbi:MAG: PorV/PorQ family protein [candidate division KSB1 bacterium]|nr:PorV/PorQ family protein [candidate division KSB1 bacterium]